MNYRKQYQGPKKLTKTQLREANAFTAAMLGKQPTAFQKKHVTTKTHKNP